MQNQFKETAKTFLDMVLPAKPKKEANMTLMIVCSHIFVI